MLDDVKWLSYQLKIIIIIYIFRRFLLIPGPLSRPCDLFYKSIRCAGEITLVILPPSHKYSKLVRFLLGSGATVYFLPGFLVERKPSTCGTDTKSTDCGDAKHYG